MQHMHRSAQYKTPLPWGARRAHCLGPHRCAAPPALRRAPRRCLGRARIGRSCATGAAAARPRRASRDCTPRRPTAPPHGGPAGKDVPIVSERRSSRFDLSLCAAAEYGTRPAGPAGGTIQCTLKDVATVSPSTAPMLLKFWAPTVRFLRECRRAKLAITGCLPCDLQHYAALSCTARGAQKRAVCSCKRPNWCPTGRLECPRRRSLQPAYCRHRECNGRVSYQTMQERAAGFADRPDRRAMPHSWATRACSPEPLKFECGVPARDRHGRSAAGYKQRALRHRTGRQAERSLSAPLCLYSSDCFGTFPTFGP